MSGFQAPNPSLFFSRNDSLDPRLGELAKAVHQCHTTQELRAVLPKWPSFVIAGYADDEGIEINGGRKGAKEGPDAIRKFLYKMTPALQTTAKPAILDLGNLILNRTLAERHETAKEFAAVTMASGHRWVSLGGGHDYGYPDAAAFCSTYKNERPLVINFDAHLDVRPTDRGLTSGTPFFRLLEEYPQIDFVEIGIQNQCNSNAHLEWLKRKNGRVVFLDEILTARDMILPVLNRAGDLLDLKRPTFLSIDIDVFDSSYAPGCSQSWPVGMHPIPFMRLLTELSRRLDIRGVGIYEVSPPLDNDDRTAKLAAIILHKLIYQWAES